MPGADAPRRHWRVWLTPSWARFLRSPLSAADQDVVEAWRARNQPMVAARHQPEDPPDGLRLGLAPPGQPRIGLHLAMDAVADIAAPLDLDTVLDSVPALWRPALQSLAASTAALGVSARVFGSVAWQHFSGESYLRPDSDVDLLFAPADWGTVERLLAVLERHDGTPRLDGEMLLPDGGGVAWRELASGYDRVLVKAPGGVSLWPRAAVVTAFERTAA